MNLRNRKQVLLALGLVCLAIFGAGVAYWFTSGRHHVICSDGKPPLQQMSGGLNQLMYRCHDGEIVTAPILP